ncbi:MULTISPECIES: hypothetical protein [Cupriavidus]|uniref:Uncharacterized protein n=1 Tax=Cupriavidus cauae TaxID=2608999 RepID=A0A5M8ABG2_9BURK|nr:MULTISPECIES: hypothetical protein [Cupriavidus]KAA6118304.1 hypothetical protein F1599_21980 [Cupriavidus cauae]MCA7085189.1 hypothetical protein [Cupriavidus sp. DB3]
MNPITPHRRPQVFAFASMPEAPPSQNVAAMPKHGADDNGPPDCTAVRAMAMRLDQAIGSAGSNDPDAFVTLRVADLRQMDSWGVTIHGETLRSYFDLGSIDDVEQRYPVTLDEARWLRRALAALNDGHCASINRNRRWRPMA